MKDNEGRSYATELKAGDIVTVDGSFGCAAGENYEVQDSEFGLYIEGNDGKHYLKEQLVEEWYVGVYKAGEEKKEEEDEADSDPSEEGWTEEGEAEADSDPETKKPKRKRK
jgi:hypothetical protein